MIESREELHEYLKYEKDLNLGHISKKDRILYVLRSHPYAMVWKYIKALADNITVAAGAVVVTSFLEPGITVGGVPAKRIK